MQSSVDAVLQLQTLQKLTEIMVKYQVPSRTFATLNRPPEPHEKNVLVVIWSLTQQPC
ncbi:hypothetical protein AG1IA_06290 [Rhizoctonia solani AG-1 IA]|uniref:Uncharacterized protein n=1 Tax=Thanatephorus cucumeris (strain AG1-IA) TaxID=983506 RepID=L8WTI5_THACA|nr:hypothetical protein AG1IA_06290 [Rhizoctonia solani AG-1 IA]